MRWAAESHQPHRRLQRGLCVGAEGQPSDLMRGRATPAGRRSGRAGTRPRWKPWRRTTAGSDARRHRPDRLAGSRNRTGPASRRIGGSESTHAPSATKPAPDTVISRALVPGSDRFAAIVRGHWGIENQQHWVLDVQFGGCLPDPQDHSAETWPDPSHAPQRAAP